MPEEGRIRAEGLNLAKLLPAVQNVVGISDGLVVV